MNKLLITLSLICSQAFAQVAPSEVAAECVRQMSMGICLATPDRASIAPGQTMLIAGVGRVQYSAYLDYMDKYNPALPSDPAMCDLALTYMEAEPGSEHDLIARALWLPTPKPESSFIKNTIQAAVGIGSVLVAYMMFRRRKLAKKSKQAIG